MRTTFILALLLAPTAHAERLIYSGILAGAPPAEDGAPAHERLDFSICDLAGQCGAALEKILVEAVGDDFSYALTVMAAELPTADTLRVELDGAELVRQPLSTVGFDVGCRRPPATPIVVGDGGFETVAEAVASLDDVCIPADEDVRIEVAPGEHVAQPPVVLRHPQGDRIRIVGAGSDVTVLHFDRQAIIADHGRSIRLVDGVTLRGPEDAAEGGSVSMIVAQRGGRVVLGQDVRVVDAGLHAIHAGDRGEVVADRLHVEGCGGDGLRAENAGWIRAEGATVERCESGAQALFKATIIAHNARVIGARSAGFRAAHGAEVFVRNFGRADGHVDCDAADGEPACAGAYDGGEAAPGFVVEDGGYLLATGTRAERNQIGFVCRTGATLRAQASQAIENDLDGYEADACVLFARDAVALRNGGQGFQAANNATADLLGATADDNERYGAAIETAAYAVLTDFVSNNNSVAGYLIRHHGLAGTTGATAEGNGNANRHDRVPRLPPIEPANDAETAATALTLCAAADPGGAVDAVRIEVGETGDGACERRFPARNPVCLEANHFFLSLNSQGEPLSGAEINSTPCDHVQVDGGNPNNRGTWACCERN